MMMEATGDDGQRRVMMGEGMGELCCAQRKQNGRGVRELASGRHQGA